MQVPTQSAADKRRSRLPGLIMPIFMLFLSACAVQRPFRFHASSVTRISYNPAHCIEMQDGTFKCNDVIFHVATVEPAPTK